MAGPCNNARYRFEASSPSSANKKTTEQRKDLEEKKLEREGYEEEFKARAQLTGIDMMHDVVELIDDLDGGYVGKPKGITEIAWERVFLRNKC